MTTVFVGGSRKIVRLDAAVRERLDRIIAKKLHVLIGDANGADKAVQSYLWHREYDSVEVFCMDGICRNNIGGWVTRSITAAKKAKGFDYYSMKDEEMTKESTIGFMLWDGKSRGTLSNISRLLDQKKKAVVYVHPRKEFLTLSDREEWQTFLEEFNKAAGKLSRGGRSFPRDQHATT